MQLMSTTIKLNLGYHLELQHERNATSRGGIPTKAKTPKPPYHS
jgi:hypothetical protein